MAELRLVRPMSARSEKRQFTSNADFYTFIDTITQRLCSGGLVQHGERLNTLVHKVAWTTSTELFGELRIALRKIREERTSVDAALLSDITVAIVAIDDAFAASARASIQCRVPPQKA